jgi:hypothetical protein
MFLFLLFAMLIILLGMVGLKIIDNIFSEKDYFIIMYIFLIGITINSLILLFLEMVFKDYEFKKGEMGEIGSSGKIGLSGMPDYCSDCNKPENTLGDEKIRLDKKKIRVEQPDISSNIKGKPIN